MAVDPQTHRALAVDANNSTWEFLGRPFSELSADDVEQMTRRAYAAAYHWSQAAGATIANEARAEWLLSRVWAVQSRGELALLHANRCIDACSRGELQDFDLAYAHESLARSYACLGDIEQARAHRDTASRVPIADAEDRAIVLNDIATEPWFGLGDTVVL